MFVFLFFLFVFLLANHSYKNTKFVVGGGAKYVGDICEVECEGGGGERGKRKGRRG